MEKTPVYETGECRFDPCRRRSTRRSSAGSERRPPKAEAARSNRAGETWELSLPPEGQANALVAQEGERVERPSPLSGLAALPTQLPHHLAVLPRKRGDSNAHGLAPVPCFEHGSSSSRIASLTPAAESGRLERPSASDATEVQARLLIQPDALHIKDSGRGGTRTHTGGGPVPA